MKIVIKIKTIVKKIVIILLCLILLKN